jgi:hypothetical protein
MYTLNYGLISLYILDSIFLCENEMKIVIFIKKNPRVQSLTLEFIYNINLSISIFFQNIYFDSLIY